MKDISHCVAVGIEDMKSRLKALARENWPITSRHRETDVVQSNDIYTLKAL